MMEAVDIQFGSFKPLRTEDYFKSHEVLQGYCEAVYIATDEDQSFDIFGKLKAQENKQKKVFTENLNYRNLFDITRDIGSPKVLKVLFDKIYELESTENIRDVMMTILPYIKEDPLAVN